MLIHFAMKKLGKIILKYQLLHIIYSDLIFFLVKGVRASVWKTKDIVIGGKNPTDFAHIGNQVQFIDTIKYFQQSLGALVNGLTSSEKVEIYKECEKYLLKDDKLSSQFLNPNQTDKEWILEYLSSGKGAIPYELITDYYSLNISPDKYLFEIRQFYSNMKDLALSTKDYKNVKRFYTLLKMSNLGELNQVYNFQDIIILCEIFEQIGPVEKNIQM